MKNDIRVFPLEFIERGQISISLFKFLNWGAIGLFISNIQYPGITALGIIHQAFKNLIPINVGLVLIATIRLDII